MFHSKKNTLILILVSCFLSLVAKAAFAAEYSIVSGENTVVAGQMMKADIVIDTGKELLNAFSVKINYPTDLLSVKEIRDGGSIVTFWSEKPAILADKGQIFFSGITPGGYNDKTGELLEIVFEAKQVGEGRVYFEEAEALLNDGLGTHAAIQKNDLRFSVLGSGAVSPVVQEIIDNELPDEFVPVAAKDRNIFDGQWFLVFATQDRGSGIDRYEVREDSSSISPWTGEWHAAQSPYLLEDQSLKSRIFVKAVDRSGNERIEVLEPQNETRWYENYPIWGIIIIIAVLSLFIGVFLVKKHKKRKNSNV